jgi:hypothetical protein
MAPESSSPVASTNISFIINTLQAYFNFVRGGSEADHHISSGTEWSGKG